MKLEFTMYSQSLAVKLFGELDQHACSQIKHKIDVEIENAGKRNLIFDLSGVDMMDSSGIGLMIGRYKKLRSIGGKVVASGASGGVRRVIDLSGITKIIPLYQVVDEAVMELDMKEEF